MEKESKIENDGKYRGISRDISSIDPLVDITNVEDLNNIIQQNIEYNCAYFTISKDGSGRLDYTGNWQFNGVIYGIKGIDGLQNSISLFQFPGSRLKKQIQCSLQGDRMTKKTFEDEEIKHVSINVVMDHSYRSTLLESPQSNLNNMFQYINLLTQDLNIKFYYKKLIILSDKMTSTLHYLKNKNILERFETFVRDNDYTVDVSMWYLLTDCKSAHQPEKMVSINPYCRIPDNGMFTLYKGKNPTMTYSCLNDNINDDAARKILSMFNIRYYGNENTRYYECKSGSCAINSNNLSYGEISKEAINQINRFKKLGCFDKKKDIQKPQIIDCNDNQDMNELVKTSPFCKKHKLSLTPYWLAMLYGFLGSHISSVLNSIE